jgi:hypothetical protein
MVGRLVYLKAVLSVFVKDEELVFQTVGSLAAQSVLQMVALMEFY